MIPLANNDDVMPGPRNSSNAGPPSHDRSANFGRGWLFLLATGVCVAAVIYSRSGPDVDSGESGFELLQRAKAACSIGAYRRALEYASQILEGDEAWVESRLIAGTAAEEIGDLNTAIDYLAAYPRDGSVESAQAQFLLGVVYRQLGRISDAEGAYQIVLQIQPEHPKANADLGYLMSITGRPWSARHHFQQLLLTESWTLKSLCLLTDPEQPTEHTEYLDYCFQESPHDPLVLLGMAGRARVDGKPTEALRLAHKSAVGEFDRTDALAFLGELVAAAANPDVKRWYADLIAQSNEHAGVWFAKGLLARRGGELEVAARCFWETIRREPTHRRACHQLGQILKALNKPGAQDFIERAEELADVSQSVSTAWSTDAGKPEDLKRLIGQLERMGRLQEAWAWAVTAAAKFPASSGFSDSAKRLTQHRTTKSAEPTAMSLTLNVALRYDFSDLPDGSEIAWNFDADSLDVRMSPTSSISESTIRFAERTDIGINTTYYSAADPSVEGVRYFETTGGGVAVIDIDHDDWPDLYFTQGTEWPHGENQPQPSDRFTDKLFRNRNATFTEVGNVSNTLCRDYGQGCAVGDFNNDGFDDLYVANIGRNRLYSNQGDGTFMEVTDTAGIGTSKWTASVVVVDLNADGNPELFDVNYVTASDVYTRICEGGSCGPDAYSGVPDTLHVSNGDGTFTLLSEVTSKLDGKGLGVVAAVIDDPQRPALFVANDAVPNFLLKSLPSDKPANLRFVDDGMLAGVAANGEGSVTGTMGIAVDDVDQNGLIDFFVTNFVSEANSLYLQDVPGLFIDATYPARLHAPSLSKVAWGTQFLDADLDGDADLVIVNGHVDDYQIDDQGYQMQPQFFRNDGRSEFSELPSGEVGAWFERRIHGRGLARIDYNNDGRMDFVASIVGDPAALLENRSANVGGHLTIRLIATTTARDAIGTQVDIKTAAGLWTKQLTAGDGYMASNHRVIPFGLGAVDSIAEVTIRWPSGASSTIKGVAVNSHLIVTEQTPSATITSRPEFSIRSIGVEVQ